MADELILELRLESKDAVKNIVKIVDAISSIDQAAMAANDSMKKLWKQFVSGKSDISFADSESKKIQKSVDNASMSFGKTSEKALDNSNLALPATASGLGSTSSIAGVISTSGVAFAMLIPFFTEMARSWLYALLWDALINLIKAVKADHKVSAEFFDIIKKYKAFYETYNDRLKSFNTEFKTFNAELNKIIGGFYFNGSKQLDDLKALFNKLEKGKFGKDFEDFKNKWQQWPVIESPESKESVYGNKIIWVKLVEKSVDELIKKKEESCDVDKKVADCLAKTNEVMAKGVTEATKRTKSMDKEIEAEKEILLSLPEVTRNFGFLDETIAALTKEYLESHEEIKKNTEETIELTDEQKKLAKQLGMTDKEFDDFSKATGKVGKNLTSISDYGKQALGILKDTGLVSGKTAEAMGGLMDGIGQVGQGFAELAKDPVSGALKILGGVVKSVTNLFKLFAGDGVGEAIEREREFIDISEEMEERIRKLEEELKDTHAATSMLMSEIIKEAEINADNLGNYVKRTQDILADLDRGTLSIQEVQESMGKAFNELIAEAQKLGMEGSREMVALLGDLRNRGIEVAEIQEYVNAQLESGIEAFTKYLETFNFTGTITAQIEELEKKLAETTAGTLEHAEQTAELAGLYIQLEQSISGVETNFDSMGAYALGLFNALIKEGSTFLEAVRQMGSALTILSQIARDNGIEISGALREMLDMQFFIDQNETLVTRIDATTQMLQALGNTGYLTAEIFNQFQADAQVQFDALMEKTNNATLAYQLMAPELGKLAWYATQYGFQLDEGTRKMIAQAEQHGVNMSAMIPAQEKIVALLEELVKVLGGDIPYAMDSMAQSADRAFKKAGESADRFDKRLKNMKDISFDFESGEPVIKAAGGFSGWVRKPTSFLIGEGGEPEFVSVIPRHRLEHSRQPVGNGDIVFEHISIYGENSEEVVREFMSAIKGNKYGIQNLIKKVAQ